MGLLKEKKISFSSRGGIIPPDSETTISLQNETSKLTEFNRRGMVYVMDAWVRKADVVRKGNSNMGFQEACQGVRMVRSQPAVRPKKRERERYRELPRRNG